MHGSVMRQLPVSPEIEVNEAARLVFTFAASLNNLGSWLGKLGRHKEALTALQEAVEIRRTLAAIDPEGFRPDLAVSLYNLGSRLSALGHSRTLAGFGRAPDIALLYSIVEVLWTHPAGWGREPEA